MMNTKQTQLASALNPSPFSRSLVTKRKLQRSEEIRLWRCIHYISEKVLASGFGETMGQRVFFPYFSGLLFFLVVFYLEGDFDPEELRGATDGTKEKEARLIFAPRFWEAKKPLSFLLGGPLLWRSQEGCRISGRKLSPINKDDGFDQGTNPLLFLLLVVMGTE